MVGGARRPPRKGVDDGDRLGGIEDWARGGGGGCVRERGDPWEADLRRKGWGGRIGALGRVVGEGASGHGWPVAQGIGSGGGGEGGDKLERGRARGREEVDVRKRFGRCNRSDGLRQGRRRTTPRRVRR
jgi:hypothetical protein